MRRTVFEPRGAALAGGVLLAVAAGVLPLAAGGAPPEKGKTAELVPNKELAEKLKVVREEHKLPALWGAIVQGEKVTAIAAVGVRKAESPEVVTIDDHVHLGSNTKAMTATLIALLVEQKKLRWDSTVSDVFPDLKDNFHEDLKGVTVGQLLAHQAGLKPNILWLPTPEGTSLRADRRKKVVTILKDEPKEKPGTKFLYSNSGYVVAAAMAEEVMGEDYEQLMRTLLFKPLGMASAGLGPPGTKGSVEQPWGHTFQKEKLTPSQHDNWAIMAPAGGVHCSLSDWAKFTSVHLRGAQGKGPLLQAEAFKHLHTPLKGFTYAGGWAVVGDSRILAHDGSNTMWYARMQLYPKDNVAFLVAMNAGGEEMTKATDAAVRALDSYYLTKLDKK